jgi:aspartyl-tRNA(Asn)/glutamyl-tRNA(Gln) amidotransferase subunit B
LEIVSEPEIKSGEEAYQYVTEVRKLVRYLEICDGNMEEGSLRCDANISIMPKGSKKFGTKVEVKNMNSIRNVQRAIEYEIKRQAELLEKGEIIKQETRSFDAVSGTTFSLRSKEGADDYRYFPEPDLQPVIVTGEYKQKVKSLLPPLPDELFKKYSEDLKLSTYDAGVLTESKEIALYFEELIKHCNNYKAAANWVMGDIKSFLNERALHISNFPLTPKAIASLINLIEEGKVSHSAASQKIFPLLIENPAKTPLEIAQENNLIQESNADSILPMIEEVIAKYPEKVEEYRAGKKGLLGLFVGEVMKLSKGKADPKITNQLVREKLES